MLLHNYQGNTTVSLMRITDTHSDTVELDKQTAKKKTQTGNDFLPIKANRLILFSFYCSDLPYRVLGLFSNTAL